MRGRKGGGKGGRGMTLIFKTPRGSKKSSRMGKRAGRRNRKRM